MLGLTLAMVAVVLTLWLVARGDWRGPSSTPISDVAAVSEPAADVAGRDPVPAVARSAASERPDTPLPPLDTPLADTFDELVARADRGDPRAACRLALELQVCDDDLSRLQYFAENATLHAGVEPDQIAADQLEQVEALMINAQAQLDAFDATQAHCRGVPEVSMDRRLGWWRQSARAGNRAAVQELVGGSALPIQEWMRHTDHLAWMGRELGPLAWRAIHEGDLETAWNMMSAVMPVPAMLRVDPLAQVTDVDGEAALALAVYLQDALASATGNAEAIEGMREMLGERTRLLEATLSPDEQARARATGREWSRTITPLPVRTSPLPQFLSDAETLEMRRARMQSCSESG